MMYLFKRQSNKQKGREREREIFHSLAHSAVATAAMSGQPEARRQELEQVSDIGYRVQALESSPAFPGVLGISRTLSLKQGSWNSSQCSGRGY